MSSHYYTWLALGDSYTIGEGVQLYESYPYQVIQLLRKAKHKWHAPEVIAQTGWTSFELAEYLIHHEFEDHYDLVTLCIGVNNQYRNLDVVDFADELDFLVKKAIHFARGESKHVVVISIPDWSLTPFAKGRDQKNIAASIDMFNESIIRIAKNNNVAFLDLRMWSDANPLPDKMLASDGLHYSKDMYALWAETIVESLNEMYA